MPTQSCSGEALASAELLACRRAASSSPTTEGQSESTDVLALLAAQLEAGQYHGVPPGFATGLWTRPRVTPEVSSLGDVKSSLGGR
jgi:hypothetical protein